MSEILVPIFICAVMPVMIVWLIMRSYIYKENARRDIIISAIEKNPDVNVMDLMEKAPSASKEKKTLKEKLLNKLLWGCICTFIGIIGGIVLLIAGCSSGYNECLFVSIGSIAAPCLAVGIAFLINYYIGKKMLASEIEAEEKHKLGQ